MIRPRLLVFRVSIPSMFQRLFLANLNPTKRKKRKLSTKPFYVRLFTSKLIASVKKGKGKSKLNCNKTNSRSNRKITKISAHQLYSLNISYLCKEKLNQVHKEVAKAMYVLREKQTHKVIQLAQVVKKLEDLLINNRQKTNHFSLKRAFTRLKMAKKRRKKKRMMKMKIQMVLTNRRGIPLTQSSSLERLNIFHLRN